MANALFDKARERFLRGQFNWDTDDVQVLLVDTGAYTVNLVAHEFLADVSLAARIAGPVALVNRSSIGGAADGDDVTFSNVSGTTIEAIILFVNTGVEATSPLVAYIDTATGLPITPNNGDIILTWDNGPNRIFRL